MISARKASARRPDPAGDGFLEGRRAGPSEIAQALDRLMKLWRHLVLGPVGALRGDQLQPHRPMTSWSTSSLSGSWRPTVVGPRSPPTELYLGVETIFWLHGRPPLRSGGPAWVDDADIDAGPLQHLGSSRRS